MVFGSEIGCGRCDIAASAWGSLRLRQFTDLRPEHRKARFFAVEVFEKRDSSLWRCSRVLGSRRPAAWLATEFAAACPCAADAVCAVDAEEAAAAQEAVKGDWFGRFGESESGALETKQCGSSNGSLAHRRCRWKWPPAAGRWRWSRHGRRG